MTHLNFTGSKGSSRMEKETSSSNSKASASFTALYSLSKRKWKWKWKSLRCVWLFATPWTIQSLKSSRPEYWSEQPFPLGSNPGLPHCRQLLYQLSHKGSPRILQWVAYPFSMGSSQTRNQSRVSCIAGGFFTNWAIREAPFQNNSVSNIGLWVARL